MADSSTPDAAAQQAADAALAREQAETTQAAAANAQQFLITGVVPSSPVLPTPGIDTTEPGGVYRVGDQWVDANGDPRKPPKGSK